jgi:hypothetical protein
MDALVTVLQAVGLALWVGLVGWVTLLFVQIAVENITDWLDERRRRRIVRIEAELDAKAAELRRTILGLAEQLAAERDEASRAMTRAAFLASGKTPPLH